MSRIALTRIHDRISTSLWFVPSLAVILAFVAAHGLLFADRRLEPDFSAWYLFAGSHESARSLMSTIASSMITFTALVFSITILVLQLASGQFSPRVLRTFLEDRTTKIAMAIFVSTFVYALALLPKIRGEADDISRFVPTLSVLVGLGLVLASVGVFIKYIHHMANAVRAVTIIKHISAETRAEIESMYPDTVLEGPARPAPAPPGPPTTVIAHAGKGGILSAVNQDLLIELACGAGVVVAVVPLHGDFVPCGAPLFRVWGRATFEASELRGAVMIDIERTLDQDPLFGFRQLVDIAERALSPGVNDPSTAVQALDEIHDLLRMLATREIPSSRRVDEAGELRLIMPRPDWEAYVHLGLDEIRQYGRGSVQVARRLRALLEDCLTVTTGVRRLILEEQRGLLEESIRRDIVSPTDREIARRPSQQGHGQA